MTTITTPARKLASIQRVNAVEPIEGADAIERIRVLGWWVVVKKGEFQPGDVCVYCEIDSLMPDRPEFAFLRERSNGRIKTVRLRGQVSQGICFPLSVLPERLAFCIDETQEGRDVTEALGVVKWEPPQRADSSTMPLAPLPGFIPKTDETRVQVLETLLERWQGRKMVATEKVDGSSMTVFVREGVFGVCSRNCHLEDVPGCNFWDLAKREGLQEKLLAWCAESGAEIAVQGELVGPGVQGNKLKLKAHAFLVFNVYSITRGEFLEHQQTRAIAADLGLTPVPVVGDSFQLRHTIDELVEMATGKSVIAPDVEREGLVFRPVVEANDPDVGRLSFKAINPRFLLKFDA